MVIAGDASGLGAGIGDALGVPFLELAGADAETASEGLASAERLVWIHPVPALAAGSTLDGGGLFSEALALVGSARSARALAERSGASLVFIAALPARGLLTGDRGAACDMATGAMESMMRVEIGPWSNAGHRLLAVVYPGLVGYTPDGVRSEDETRKRTPMHELCTFRQLADAIRFVGSERAAYITGTSLHVDGGWNAYSWMYPARTI